MALESVLTGERDPTNLAEEGPLVVANFFLRLEAFGASEAVEPVGTHQVWSLTKFYSVHFLFKIKDWCKKVHLQHTLIQGLRQLFLTLSVS